MKRIIICTVCLLTSFVFAFAASADSLYSQAQKLYGQGNFEAAAKTYAGLCSMLEAKDKKTCQINEARSLIEANKIHLAREAEPKLLWLISETEPNDSLFAELSALDTKLQIMLDQPVRSVRSWKAAQASASVDYFPQIYVLCRDIISAYPTSGLTAENCEKIKPTDTTLLSLPRKKITPLPGASSQPAVVHYATPAPAPTSAPAPAPAPVSTPSGAKKWYVQLGAFGAKENADKLVADFKNKGVQLYIVELTDRKLFTVRAGEFATKEDAENFAVQKISPTHKDYKVLQ
ncbi:MAG: SPOR domain-containing protein [Fibromonadales bacterium]|nr:SPOR domain-containing protein [Fibromonadales bacterium]